VVRRLAPPLLTRRRRRRRRSGLTPSERAAQSRSQALAMSNTRFEIKSAREFRALTRWTECPGNPQWRSCVGWKVRTRLCPYCSKPRTFEIGLVRRFSRPSLSSDGPNWQTLSVPLPKRFAKHVEEVLGHRPKPQRQCQCDRRRYGP